MKNAEIEDVNGTVPNAPVSESNNTPNNSAPTFTDTSTDIGPPVEPDISTESPFAPISSAPPDYGMPVHPVADIFPVMTDSKLDELARDIKAGGLRGPIVLHEGKVVDGRNRLLACRKAEVQPRYKEWRDIDKGEMTISRWIWSINAERRHMSNVQLAAARLAVTGWEEREAAMQRKAEGQRQGGETAGRGRPKPDSLLANSPVSYSPGSADTPDAAKATPAPKKSHSEGRRTNLSEDHRISKHQAKQLLAVENKSPDVLSQIARGEVKLPAAAKQATEASPKPAPPPAGPQVWGSGSKKEKAAKQARLEKLIARAVQEVGKILNGVPPESQKKFKEHVAWSVRRLA